MVGGGDGGVVRELAKLSSVEKVVQCEIDAEVGGGDQLVIVTGFEWVVM